MPENYANRYGTTLAAGVTSGALTGTVDSVTGVPTVPFRAIISAEGANTDEIVLVTGQASTTLTWTRAAEAVAGVQAASAHGIGATFTAILTAAAITALAGNPLTADLDVGGFLVKGAAAVGGTGAAVELGASSAGAGGTAVVTGGAGIAAEPGGDLQLRAGMGNAGAQQPARFVFSGNAGNGSGGDVDASAGDGEAGQAGGNATFSGGNGNAGGSSAGALILNGGNSAATSGHITLTTGGLVMDLRAGSADPSAGAGVAANVGSLYIRVTGGVGTIWLKTGAAATAWTNIT